MKVKAEQSRVLSIRALSGIHDNAVLSSTIDLSPCIERNFPSHSIFGRPRKGDGIGTGTEYPTSGMDGTDGMG